MNSNIRVVTSKDRKAIATLERRSDFLAERVAQNTHGKLDHDKRELWALNHVISKFGDV